MACLRIYSGDTSLAGEIATNHRISDITEKQLTMLDVAAELTASPGEAVGSDVDRLREASYSLELIWDIASYHFSNRLALRTDMRSSPKFDEFGR